MLSKLTFTPAVGSAIDIHASTGSYKVSRAEGISGPPAPRDVLKVAPGRAGSLDDTRMVSHRDIVIEGEIIGTSQTDVWTKWDALAAAFQSTLLVRGTLTVTLPDATERQISVVLSGAAQPSFEGGSAYLQYQLNLRAPDPHWYSTTVKTGTVTVSSMGITPVRSSSVNLVNAGNAPTPLVIGMTKDLGGANFSFWYDWRVTPPTAYSASVSNPQIFQTGHVSEYGPDTMTVDTGTRTTATTGTHAATVAATSEWPLGYPGTSSWTAQVGDDGSGVAPRAVYHFVVSWRDAWW